MTVKRYEFSTGQLWLERQFNEDGERHGISRWWHLNGELAHINYYLYGNKVTEEEYRRHELVEKLAGL